DRLEDPSRPLPRSRLLGRRAHLRIARQARVRTLRGPASAGQEGDDRLLRLPGQGPGLPAQEAARVPLSLRLPSASARRATRGMTASTGIATTGQMTARAPFDGKYPWKMSMAAPAASGPMTSPSPLVVVASPVIVPRSLAGMTLKSRAQARVMTTPPAIATRAISP